MNDLEKKMFVEEAIEYGYIDYDKHGYISLFYNDHEIWPGPTINRVYFVYISEEFAVNSKELYDKLKSMLKAWEAI